MIARVWRGAVKRDDAEEYAQYIRDTGFAEYARTDGNRGWVGEGFEVGSAGVRRSVR